MPILQPVIERKLSSLLGAPVTFDKLNVSLIAGSIEAHGVRAGDFLTIAKIRSEIAVTKALKGEIVVKSLTIERPAVTITRRDDAALNLPRKKKSDEKSMPDDDKTTWKFDVEKLLLVDGSIRVELGDYELTAPRVLAQLRRDGNGYAVTFLAESVARVDQPIEIGAVGVTGKITGAADLTAVADASVSLELLVGDFAKIKYDSPRVRSLRGNVQFSGGFELSRILDLLP